MDAVFAVYVVALVAHIAAHIACVVAIVRAAKSESAYDGAAASPLARFWRLAKPLWAGLLAFLLPPLAAFQAWRRGARRAALCWVATFLVYALLLPLLA